MNGIILISVFIIILPSPPPFPLAIHHPLSYNTSNYLHFYTKRKIY